MAKQVLTQCYVEINAVDRSANVSKVEFTDQFEEKDVTTFGSLGAKEVLAGLESGSIGLSFKNDFAFGTIDASMWALRGTVVGMKLRPSQAAVSTSNPSYQFNVLVKEWKPIAAAVGDVAETDVTWTMTGTVTRTTQ
jgi:hypothetical protein